MCQRFLRNFCAYDFEIWYRCWVWLVVLCKRKSAYCCLSFPLSAHFSFASIKFLSQSSLLQWQPESSNFVHTLRGAKYIVGKPKPKCCAWFLPSFYIFLFPPLLLNVIHVHREICVQGFSGTTAPRILKFDTNVAYDSLYCVKKINMLLLIIPLICLFFFLSKQIFCYKCLSCYDSSLKICIHIESDQLYCGTENKTEIYFVLFPFSHLSLQYNIGKFVTNISQEIVHVGFGTNIVNHLLFYVKENQTPPTYSSVNVFIFLSLKFSNNKKNHFSFPRNWQTHKVPDQCLSFYFGPHIDSRLMYHVYLNQAAGAYLFRQFSFSQIPKH